MTAFDPCFANTACCYYSPPDTCARESLRVLVAVQVLCHRGQAPASSLHSASICHGSEHTESCPEKRPSRVAPPLTGTQMQSDGTFAPVAQVYHSACRGSWPQAAEGWDSGDGSSTADCGGRWSYCSVPGFGGFARAEVNPERHRECTENDLLMVCPERN